MRMVIMLSDQFGYDWDMSRVAPSQADLFAPAQPDFFASPQAGAIPPAVDPIFELHALLKLVRDAAELPWPDAASAMAEEQRTLWLAAIAGEEGARLAENIFTETERLFSVGERNAASGLIQGF